jgi:hypothetical protein
MKEIAGSFKEPEFIAMDPQECLRGIRKDFRTAQQQCNAKGHYRLTITPKRFAVRREDQSSIFVDIQKAGCPNSKLLYAYYRIVANEPEFKGVNIDFRSIDAVIKIDGEMKSIHMMALTFRVPRSQIANRDALKR